MRTEHADRRDPWPRRRKGFRAEAARSRTSGPGKGTRGPRCPGRGPKATATSRAHAVPCSRPARAPDPVPQVQGCRSQGKPPLRTRPAKRRPEVEARGGGPEGRPGVEARGGGPTGRHGVEARGGGQVSLSQARGARSATWPVQGGTGREHGHTRAEGTTTLPLSQAVAGRLAAAGSGSHSRVRWAPGSKPAHGPPPGQEGACALFRDGRKAAERRPDATAGDA